MRRVALVLAAMALALLLASGVAWAVNKIGTNGPDTLTGTNRADNLLGRGGNDDISGLGGPDELLGGGGRDVLQGGPAPPRPEFPPRCEASSNNNDVIVGGAGNDFLNGNIGTDRLVGGRGHDVLWEEVCFRGDGEPGTFETLIGGAGNDFLWVRDTPFPVPREDLVLCGAGRDVASVDRVDVVVGCERLMFRHPTHEEHLRILAKRGLEGRV
jgi:RTX calcium-binding nonapeptide repeat (4 copies)